MTGFIIVNKQVGVSSAREVAIIKRLSGVSCGHMGTLDPLASGVLPVAVGNATRLFDYFLDKKKTYIATFKFGVSSDTLDISGQVINSGERVPEREEIEKVIPSLCGEVMQVPPNYSAKNINGVRGYQLARQGVQFTLPPKKVNIYSIKLLDKTKSDSFSFEIECGGGTYIRSIARDMAKLLQTSAIMSSLVRTKSGVFDIERSVKSDELNYENFSNYLIATDSVLQLDAIYASTNEEKRLFNGLSVPTDKKDGIYKLYKPEGSFYGLAEVKQSILKVRTKLC